MRGKAHFKQALLEHLGITPAYAGKRNCGRQSRCSTSDHPRVCGEKFFAAYGAMPLSGSPPRMRGKVGALYCKSPVDGITPACAGKSTHPNKTLHGSRDHPRMCGEKAYINAAMDGGVGSPPHVRGKVPPLLGFGLMLRITPACAGKSSHVLLRCRCT